MNVCVFCSSSDAVDRVYLDVATEMGAMIGAAGHALVFGGGAVGLMGATARAVQRGGGKVIGIIPTFMNRPGVPYSDCDELQFTADMRERKTRMIALSQAFICLPGGFGTLEEMSEVITQKQFNFVKAPLVAVNTLGFYDSLAAFFEEFYRRKFAKPDFRATCPFVATPRDAMGYVTTYVPPAPTSKWF